MCGIVAYFGGAGNNLTRVLTGMSAIIYRAPDSTGVGMFGDDTEPIRTRKAVGSVEKLVVELLENCMYQNHENRLFSVWTHGHDPHKMVEMQRDLLVFEGLPLEQFEAATSGDASYPAYDELVDLKADRPCRLRPGQTGRPGFDIVFCIRSRKNLMDFIGRLIEEYDLSPVVIREIIRKPLTDQIASKRAAGLIDAEPGDILSTFDRIFDKALSTMMIAKPAVIGPKMALENPSALKALWRCLPDTMIPIPSDYDRDGVCCLFRLLDAALLAATATQPALMESLEKILDVSWPGHERSQSVDWRRLYGAEKGVNVYGKAAAAALMCLQRDDFLTEILDKFSPKRMMTEASILPGQTDPVSLRYFTQPIIAHGRWALQSAVTVKNAHPFMDEKRFRSVVLNGQFDGNTEESIRKFLAKAANFSFRSENSSEYLALLWGFYYDQLFQAQQRYKSVSVMVENHLQEYGIGSSVIDYAVHRNIRDKTAAQLDETAFIEAADQISKNGGQVAVCGISLLSPRKLYVAVRNRPVFVVRRLENDDFMVVSDINAALGLFPQQLIHEKRTQLERLAQTVEVKIEESDLWSAGEKDSKALKDTLEKEKAQILKAFSVEVHALEGEEIFARIEPMIVDGVLGRSVTLTDFQGHRLPDLEPFTTVLDPVQVKKDLGRSFYETHLAEIPQRLLAILGKYAPEESGFADPGIRKNLLRRRFGRDFSGLKRIVLAGTGSAFHMCEIGKYFFQHLMPELDMMAVRPADLENPDIMFMPEKDLVILLSWSSTTADMVLLAKKLLSLKVVMIGITEKTFADMALVIAKSGGVLPTLTGEEVTVAGVKSTVCMLFCLQLFCLWLASLRGRMEDARGYLEKMHRIPYLLANLLEDETLRKFSVGLAREHAQSKAGIVVGAVFSDGLGKEVARKLEEMSWTSIGRALDYQEVIETGLPVGLPGVLVIVDATCGPRIDEALNVMEIFFRSHTPFTAVGLEHRQEERIRELSGNRCIFLPGLKKHALQPLVTLVFYYQFAFYYGQSHGITLEMAPRNLAKSMTVGRSLFARTISPARELMEIKHLNKVWGVESVPQATAVGRRSQWEKEAVTARSRCYYQEMRELAAMISSGRPTHRIYRALEGSTDKLARYLFDANSDIDQIVFAPMDRPAAAALKSAAPFWSRMLGYPVRIISPEAPLDAFDNNVLLFTAAFLSPGLGKLAKRLEKIACPVFRLEPEMDSCNNAAVPETGGTFLLPNDIACSRSDHLYAAIQQILIAAWRIFSPEKAEIVDDQFRKSAETIYGILDNKAFKAAISTSMAVNHEYKTMFYLGPIAGVGLAWTERFERTGAMLCERHLFGESAHGPLVTVDSRVDAKFVKIEERSKMVSQFGPGKVALWENLYLTGKSTDAFISAPPADSFDKEKTPFFADGFWYFPELKPGYDTQGDNLIVMDASWNRYLDRAIDEISTYGSRYPRMILITQQAFLNGKANAALYRYPVSSTITLPRTPAGPVPDLHLPFALNLIGEELAACVP